MWVPDSIDELHARLRDGTLQESTTFDGKRELGSNNASIAVDLCAMTVQGGVIVYGVDENDAGTALTQPAPIPLSGVRERQGLASLDAPSVSRVVVLVPRRHGRPLHEPTGDNVLPDRLVQVAQLGDVRLLVGGEVLAAQHVEPRGELVGGAGAPEAVPRGEQVLVAEQGGATAGAEGHSLMVPPGRTPQGDPSC